MKLSHTPPTSALQRLAIRPIIVLILAFAFLPLIPPHAAHAANFEPKPGCEYVPANLAGDVVGSDDIMLQPGHVYSVDILDRSVNADLSAQYFADTTFILNGKVVVRNPEWHGYDVSSRFPSRGSYADKVGIPAEGAQVDLWISSIQEVSFTIEICTLNDPAPAMPIEGNPFCGHVWYASYFLYEQEGSDVPLSGLSTLPQIDVPGHYKVTVRGNNSRFDVSYDAVRENVSDPPPFAVNGVGALHVEDESYSGNEIYRGTSYFPLKSSPDDLVVSDQIQVNMNIAVGNPDAEDDFEILITCVK